MGSIAEPFIVEAPTARACVGVMPAHPDLVVHVKRPPADWIWAYARVVEGLNAGMRAVIVLDTVTRSACVYRMWEHPQLFNADQELTIPDVLPGFATPVGRLFD